MSDLQDPKVFKTYDDGYKVREMTLSDAKIVQKWYCGMGKISKYELNICLQIFPKGNGFYIGEFNGEVVASAIRIPWSDNVFYGSYYYVDERYRRKGFGTRLRDEVARVYVGDNILCVDAVVGKVAETNAKMFGYTTAFKTGRFEGLAKDDYGVKYDGKIVKSTDVPFDKLMEYDNTCFISKNNPIRRNFLSKWTTIPDGATYVALSETGAVKGYGSRRPCLQERNHQIGPLYAENANIAEALLQHLCKDVSGCQVTVNIWYPNSAAVNMVSKFGMSNVFEVIRMHVNGDPKEYKDTVFCLTSIDCCGF